MCVWQGLVPPMFILSVRSYCPSCVPTQKWRSFRADGLSGHIRSIRADPLSGRRSVRADALSGQTLYQGRRSIRADALSGQTLCQGRRSDWLRFRYILPTPWSAFQLYHSWWTVNMLMRGLGHSWTRGENKSKISFLEKIFKNFSNL